MCVCSITQSCPTLCDPLDCGLPGSAVHGIFQARILEWAAISFSRGIFPTQGSNLHVLCLLHFRWSPHPLSHRGYIWRVLFLLIIIFNGGFLFKYIPFSEKGFNMQNNIRSFKTGLLNKISANQIWWYLKVYHDWLAAAKSLQSCPTLCDPIDGSPPGSPVPGILQARTLEWVAISFSNAWKWKVKGKSLSCVWLFATPWTAAYQAPLSMEISRQEYWSGVPKLISISQKGHHHKIHKQ